MVTQIAVGTALLLINIFLAALGALVLELGFQRIHGWLMREPHAPKLVVVVAGTSLVALGVITAGLWIWALVYDAIGAFPDLETSVYFSIICYTTLGFGDLLLPKEWQILAGMEAANGFLNFGLLTALLIEGLRQIRLRQVESRRLGSR